MTEEQRPYKKFIETFTFGDDAEEYEVLTDNGWTDIKSIGKTIEYSVWYLKLSNGYSIRCADTHIVFDPFMNEVFVRDLVRGNFVMTDVGPIGVELVFDEGVTENMYDLQLQDENHRFYTDGILSHNSIWLANIAAKAVRAGHNVAIITMEMAESLYIKRLGSNMLNIPIREYKQAAEDQVLIKQKISQIGFESLTLPGQLMVKEFPTSTASTLDIEAFLRKIEEKRKIKFKVVIVDYINIMKNWRNPDTENTYMKIKQIAEDLRAMATSNEWAIITATQVKQMFFDMNDMSIGAAAESSGLVATVDLMFGIIQDPLMYSSNKYKLKVLANRGEGYKNSAKTFDVNYNYMRIAEDSVAISEGKEV